MTGYKDKRRLLNLREEDEQARVMEPCNRKEEKHGDDDYYPLPSSSRLVLTLERGALFYFNDDEYVCLQIDPTSMFIDK